MRFLLAGARTLTALALGLWIGGLVFFGAITAAVMFPATRAAKVPALAPQMVGPMLGRFAVVCAVCSVGLILGWALDGVLTTRGRGWKAQGAFLFAAMALGAYLNFALFPQIRRDQDAVLPLYARTATSTAPLSPEEAALKARFDAGHARYNRLASLDLWLFVGALACLMARTSRIEKSE